MDIDAALLLIALLTALACAIPGVWLVVRRNGMVSDAVSHAVLPGIAAAWLAGGSEQPPLLMAGAALAGLLAVWLIETLQQTQLVQIDAAVGVVFPALFSIGIVLISSHQLPISERSVLTGDFSLTVLNRLQWQGHDLGPKALWLTAGLVMVNALFSIFLYKELAISAFDRRQAAAAGFRPRLMHYLHLSLVALTSVGVFEVAGSVLVIALMVVPASTARLLSHSLPRMFGLSLLFALLSAVTGYSLASLADVSPSGSMALCSGGLFLLVWLFRTFFPKFARL